MDSNEKSTEDRIIAFLSEFGERSTSEIIKNITRENKDCIDRIPGALVALREKNQVKRRLSKERKAVVWSLID
ncbi:MAG: hypothetical protein ACFFB3_04600 [Candidatus Hodarchaeota archaeon]